MKQEKIRCYSNVTSNKNTTKNSNIKNSNIITYNNISNNSYLNININSGFVGDSQ